MDILHLIDRLEEVIKNSRRLGNVRMVDERHVWPLLDQMRISIPDQVRQAGRVVRERDRAVAQAHEEAERIVILARTEAAKLTAEHVITQAAEEQATAMREQSRREAENVRAGADEYAFDVLCKLEQEMKRALTVIENGIRAIQVEQARRENPESAAPQDDLLAAADRGEEEAGDEARGERGSEIEDEDENAAP